jgi:glycosyltransferase involved in cell wall biosynthesis
MLFTKILDREVDVFHGMAYILPFVPRSMRKVKFISTFHGLQPVLVSELPLKEKLYWATNFLMSTMFADRIISVSGNLKKEINRKYGYPLENIDVTYAGIASSFFVDGKCADKKTGNVLKKYGVVAGKYIFYSGAGNLPQKNVSTVLEAAKILAHKYHFKPRFLISRTDLTEYKDYSINAKGIMWIEERDLPCLYARAAISIYASYCEGFGSPIIEARAAGSPVITSGISAMTEAAQGKAMLVKDPFSADEWAMKIYLLYKNKKMRARLARNGRAGLEEFSWENIARKTLRSYQKVYEE